MKKSCLGCKAFNSSFNFCALGYKTESYDIMGVPGVGLRPLEKCPKPKTVAEYMYLFDNR